MSCCYQCSVVCVCVGHSRDPYKNSMGYGLLLPVFCGLSLCVLVTTMIPTKTAWDMAYCYQCSVVCLCVCWSQPWSIQKRHGIWPVVTSVPWSVCVCVGHSCDPYKNGRTDRGDVWDVDSDGPKEPCLMWGPRFLKVNGQFWGHLQPIVKYREYPAWSRVIHWVIAVMQPFTVSTAATCYDVLAIDFTVVIN